MRNSLKSGLAALAWVASTGSAQAITVVDATGDFLPSFVGTQDSDLDVTSFSVTYNGGTSTFTLGATFAGAINPALVGRYIIGVSTGPGGNAPFGTIGQPNVRFQQTVTVLKDGTGTVGAIALAAGSVTISGNAFTALVPISLLPSTGYSAGIYGFNLWPRNGGTGVAAISDFAPENSLLAVANVPEPATWLSMVLGFSIVGSAARIRRRVAALA